MTRVPKIIVSSIDSIFSNLAFEEYLISRKLSGDQSPVLFLWRNRPTITIGRHQNPWRECNLSALESHGVSLARRYSGGGAVFQDLGCTTFTFLHGLRPGELPSDERLGRNFQVIVEALKKLGITAARQGRNDVAVNGLKVSGSAFKHHAEFFLHHGTVLVDSDLGALGRLLTPDKEKLLSKGITSVGARVGNLSNFVSGMNHSVMCDSIISAFSQDCNCQVLPESLTPDSEELKDPVYREHLVKLSDWNWRFGSTPEFSHNFRKRFEGIGVFDVHVSVMGGRIQKAKVFSDCLDVKIVGNLENLLIGSLYSECFMPLRNNQLSFLANWVQEQVQDRAIP